MPPALLGLLTADRAGRDRRRYCVLNLIVQSIIQPRFIGDSVGLSVTVTFVALLFWTWLIGPIGAILAIPLTLLAKALLVDIYPKARWADALLRASAKEPEPVAEGEPTTPKKKKAHRARRDHEQPTVTSRSTDHPTVVEAADVDGPGVPDRHDHPHEPGWSTSPRLDFVSIDHRPRAVRADLGSSLGLAAVDEEVRAGVVPSRAARRRAVRRRRACGRSSAGGSSPC